MRFTDLGGHRFTCFATSARTGQLADLELRHRRRARCEDRNAKGTGLRNLPLHGYPQNQIWCQVVALACELIAWTQVLALTGSARFWEPKRLRLRLFSAAGRSPDVRISARGVHRLLRGGESAGIVGVDGVGEVISVAGRQDDDIELTGRDKDRPGEDLVSATSEAANPDEAMAAAVAGELVTNGVVDELLGSGGEAAVPRTDRESP